MRWHRLVTVATILLMVLLRVLWLDADAYSRLSWSSALLTDEGFYIHNARNLVLFGHERLDGFNNMLIMPLLHLVQVGVFRLCGVGVVQVRAISVVSSLLTLVFFWDGMRRIGGQSVANIGVLLLGLDHTNLLYNRLGLMDTPCALLMVMGWWFAACGLQCVSSGSNGLATGSTEVREYGSANNGWRSFASPAELCLLCSGVVFGSAYAVRGLAVLICWLPLLQIAALPQIGNLSNNGRKRARLRIAIAYLCGLAGAVLVYLLVWWRPNQVELAFVNHYYLQQQLLPHSLHRLGVNFSLSICSWHRGIFPYLLKHTPIQLAFALAAMTFLMIRLRESGKDSKKDSEAEIDAKYPGSYGAVYAMAVWLLIFWLFCCSVNYAPSRYYVLFYPPLAALAATAIVGIAHRMTHPMLFVTLTLGAWAFVNGVWLANWITHLTYRQRDADQWLAMHLPAKSILLGAVAPGLCVNNRFQVVNVMHGLCNDDHPVERASGAAEQIPVYILMLDEYGAEKWWKERWWQDHYPNLVDKDRRIHCFHPLLRPYFAVGLYPANRRAISDFKEKPADSNGK